MSVSRIQMGPRKFFNEDGEALRFVPVGKVVEVGDASSWYTRSHRDNPIKSRDKTQNQGARIILGFNVGIEEKVTMQDVIDLVFKVRKSQVKDAIKDGEASAHPLGGDIGATFLAQAGLWQSASDTEAHPENGAQVAIMNVIQENAKRFEDDMIEIAEEMVRQFHQEAVIVEMSVRGAVEETIQVGP